MKHENQDILREIAFEIKKAFDSWDEHIKDKRPVVTIQDLDFWSRGILDVLKTEVTE